jgi:hypothetical protein
LVEIFSNDNGRDGDKAPNCKAIEELQKSVANLRNRDAFGDFLPDSAVGLELGVALGSFSKRLLQRNKSLFLYGVDMYAGDRSHDITQYKIALKELNTLRSRYSLIRARFDEVVDLFEDEYFDFIYVDGYAHTGEEGGGTFRDWFPKAKVFGIFGGDDYHPDWPLVVKEVDEFLNEHNLPLFTMSNADGAGQEWGQWFTIKGPINDSQYLDKVYSLLDKVLQMNFTS